MLLAILAVWISVFWCIAINLIGLGSYTAIAGVFNVCAIALDWSYCIPIFCKILSKKFEPGPWHMGKLGLFVNIWACLWTLYVSVIFIMPTAIPVTAVTVSSRHSVFNPHGPLTFKQMNYAIVYLGGILFFALLYWFVRGKKFYTGPIIETEIDEGSMEERSSDDEVNTKTEVYGEIVH